MKIIEFFYKRRGVEVPYYAKYSIGLIFWKPIRKYVNVVLIPNIPFNNIRIFLYRLLGFRIGKNVFIGMKCYLDDIYPSNTIIENNVRISYGCYFAVHGIGHSSYSIIIRQGSYIGMRSNLIASLGPLEIGEESVVGACSLVNRNVLSGQTVVGIPAKPINK